MPHSNKFWAGTAESFNSAAIGMEKARAFLGSDNAPDLPSLWAKSDGVAVVDISGYMISGSSGFGRFFGVLGYDDIRAAIVAAASDSEVKSILLHINSGGGSVAGVSDLGKFIAKVAKSKPISSYTDGMMASAAYWLGSAAGSISASNTAILGSIGVISVHTERSAQLKADGIAVTVVRAGKYKALANSVEPLSEAALAEVQGQVNDIYDIFIADVAANRGVTVSTADTKLGQGKEFLGKEALSVGLIDKLATYDQALADTKKLDRTNGTSNNSLKSKGSTMKANLTEAQLSALAAGASLESVTSGAVGDTPAAAAAATGGAAAGDAAAAAAAAGDAAAAGTAGTAGTAAAVAAAGSSDTGAGTDSTVTLILAQLSSANDLLVASKVETATLKAQVETQKATHDSLLAIARAAVGKMSVAIGGSTDSAASLDASAVVSEYARVTEVFNSKFKVGGVAATAQAGKQDATHVVSPYVLAMVQAAK